jgi:hypothetical protein
MQGQESVREIAAEETIVAAAFRHPDGTVAFGPTHYHALGDRCYDEVPEEALARLEEGFLTSRGRFVDRAEAERIVVEPPDEADTERLPVGAEYYRGTLHTGDLDALTGYERKQTGVISSRGRAKAARADALRSLLRTAALPSQKLGETVTLKTTPAPVFVGRGRTRRPNTLYIEAFHPTLVTVDGDPFKIGELLIGHDGTALVALVKQEFRRQGIATRMYDAAEQQFPVRIRPQRSNSDDAKAFWATRHARGRATVPKGSNGRTT